MFNEKINLNEMVKLAKGLDDMGIPFEARSLLGGMQIVCDGWDAICHCGSYGHERGLIEIMGNIVENDMDDVEGWLSADDILARL